VIRRLTFAAVLAIGSAGAAAPLQVHNGRLFIDARINGVATEALLDSGAEATVIDPVLAAKAHLPEGTAQRMRGSGGSAAAHLVEGVTVSALGLDLHPEAVIVTDLTDVSSRLIGRPTHAIVGRELFDTARLRVDIPNAEASVVSCDRLPLGKRLPLTGHAGIEAMPVLANGHNVSAEFDLGNGSDVLISRALAKKLKLKVVGRKQGGGIGGPLLRDLVTIAWLDVAGRRFRNVTAAVDDQSNANDHNVGTAILRHFLITTDFKERSVWLQALPEGKNG
jgi:predicted aspartyl protease